MKRKIIYIDNFLTKHGYTPTTGVGLAAIFRKKGLQVITASDEKNKISRLADMLFTITKNSKNSLALIAIYSTDAFYFAWTCSILCRLLRVPYIACLHGGNLPERIEKYFKLSEQLFSKSYMNVAVSAYLEQSLIKHQWKCIVIPNSIDVALYPFKKRTSCKPALLWVRSFHEVYNPQLAIHVLKQLKNVYENAILTMVGPDKDESLAECKQLAKNLGVDTAINFTGLLLQKEWIKLSEAHDIFINTSNFDNLPVSIIEAMALGMIIITTDVGGIKYLIKNNKTGLLVQKDNAAAMCEAIKEAIINNELTSALSKQARVEAENYNEDYIFEKWKKIFDSV